jgi:hypothetical protein
MRGVCAYLYVIVKGYELSGGRTGIIISSGNDGYVYADSRIVFHRIIHFDE